MGYQIVTSLGVAGSGPSGPGPLPDNSSVWPSVVNWAALSAILDPRDGDRAPVDDLGVSGNSIGTARYIEANSRWELYEAAFTSVAAMESFNQPTIIGAVALIDDSVPSIGSDAIAYVWTGSWTRFAAGSTAGFVYTISSLTDFTPSGSFGTLKEGDYGAWALPEGTMMLRYKLVNRTAGAGGGTMPLWVPIEAYSGTNLEIDTWFLGTESNATLQLQGWTIPTPTNTGTVSSVDGYIRLNAPAVGSGNSIAQLTSPTLTGAKKFALMCEVRGTMSSTNSAAGLFQLSTETSTQWSWSNIPASGTTMRQSYWTSAWADATSSFTLKGGTGANLPTTTPWQLIVRCPGTATAGGMITTSVDGSFYSVYRRNADGATNASSFTLTPLAVGGTSGVSARLELRNYYRLVWD